MASTHQKHPAPKVAFSRLPLDPTLDEVEGSTPRTGRPSSSLDTTLIPARTTKINKPPARYVLTGRRYRSFLILPPSQNLQPPLSGWKSLHRLCSSRRPHGRRYSVHLPPGCYSVSYSFGEKRGRLGLSTGTTTHQFHLIPHSDFATFNHKTVERELAAEAPESVTFIAASVAYGLRVA